MGCNMFQQDIRTIDRLLNGLQISDGTKYIIIKDNRKVYIKIVTILLLIGEINALDYFLMMSQAVCVPHIRSMRHGKEYQIFHNNRIMDILMSTPTPSNDYNEGVSDYGDCGNLSYMKRKHVILSSLMEGGIIPMAVKDYLIKRM